MRSITNSKARERGKRELRRVFRECKFRDALTLEEDGKLAPERTEFDKDAFSKMIEAVRVYSREEIIFIFKDGTEVKADLGTEAA